MKIYDISPPLDSNYAAWPSDQKLIQKRQLQLKRGHSINLSSFQVSAHYGAHANAPRITDDESQTIGAMDLNIFVGPCQVIEVDIKPGGKIQPSDLKEEVSKERVLFKTNTANNLHVFPEDYAALSADLIEHLHQKGVKLVGIDTHGVDLYKDCGAVLAQKGASQYKMATLECLYLKDVEPGVYQLVAPPLKLMDFEASPVRALLMK